MKKIGLLVFLFSLLGLTPYVFAVEGSNGEDLLEQAFSSAISADSVVGGDSIGTTKKSVGKYVLKGGTDIKIGGKNSGIHKRESLIISITKFLLRMVMVLSVTMVIYNGVLYVVKSSEGKNAKEVLMNIVYIGVGILLALLSVVIIRFVSSIGTSTLNEITYHTFYFIS